MSDKIRVRCEFSRGGFSHERMFWIEAPGGHYTGIAYIAYCFRTDGTRLPSDEPRPGERIEGLLTARIIARPGNGIVTVSVPDGEICDVNEALIEDARVLV